MHNDDWRNIPFHKQLGSDNWPMLYNLPRLWESSAGRGRGMRVFLSTQN